MKASSSSSASTGSAAGAPLRVLLWGTCDLGKPRTRLLLRGLREQGVTVTECRADVWRGIEDKTGLRSPGRRLALLARWAFACPGLILRYLRAPAHDAVLVCHPGHLDALVVRPWARLRGARLVWDAFLGLYDTVVEDRRLVPEHGLRARLVRRFEALVARAVDRVTLDTGAQAEHFARLHGVPRGKVGVVPVGVEPERFPRAPQDTGSNRAGDRPTVLFYGQMIPLHGIGTILRAATSPRGRALRWVLVGDGQEGSVLERALAAGDSPHVEWRRWVPYGELGRLIAGADVCLGIFGESGKAARVIPNKVYQVLAAGRPLVTRDGPGVRELLGPARAEGGSPEIPGIRRVPPGDPEALLDAVEELLRAPACRPPRDLLARIGPEAVGRRARAEIARAVGEGR